MFAEVFEHVLLRFWVVVLPAIVMSQIEPLFLMNRSVFISRIVVDDTNSLVRNFLSRYVFRQVQKFNYSTGPLIRVLKPHILAICVCYMPIDWGNSI